MELVDWLMLVGSVVVVASVLARWLSRAQARGDDGSEAPAGPAACMADRVRRNWSLVALLALVASPMLDLTGQWVSVAAGAVVVWWIAEAVTCRQLPRARNPLALLGIAVRRLWSNRSLLIALVGLWLVSGTVSYFFYARYYSENAQPIPPPPVATGETSGSPAGQTQPTEQMKAPGGHPVVTVASVLPTTLARALPQAEHISVGYAGQYLLPFALFVALVWLAVKPPAWFPATLRRRLYWPLNLTLAYFLVSGVSLLPALRPMPTTMASAITMQVHSSFSILAMAALSAPFATMLWHVGMQVARGERWNLRSALLGMLDTWQPICIMAVVISVPTFFTFMLSIPPFYGSPVWVHGLGTVLKVALVLLPWIIVDQRLGLREALREAWRLARDRAPDMLVFALRFAVMFAVPAVLLRALQPHGLPSPSPTMILERLPRDLLAVLQALVIAGMYLELRGDGRSAQTVTNSEDAANAG